MIIVRFSNVDEFLDELRDDHVGNGDDYRVKIDRGLLRVTKETRPTQLGLIALSVVAGYTLPLAGGRTQLVEFRHHVGSLFDTPLDARPARELKMIEQADALVAKIEARARQLGLSVRAGFYPAGVE